MLQIPSDFSIVGTVLALAVAILLLSGLGLYVAFRIRETLKDERGGSAKTVKVAFLIGLLFLSGGVFYFFASGFSAFGNNTSSVTTGSTSVTTTSTSQSSSTTSTSSLSASSTSTVSTSATAPGSISMSGTYPSSATVGEGFYIQFTIYNSGSTTVSGGSLDLGSLAVTFSIRNATECNPQCGSVTWSGSVINLGNLVPGSTVVNIGLKAPASPTQYSGSATLNFQGETQPVTFMITIRVSGGKP